MADIKISELTQAESLSTSDLLESAVPYNGGFLSRRMSLAQLSNYLENYVQHQALTTTAKTIVSAINEILGDLANYYTISQTYSKTEVDTLIAGVSGLHFEVVQQLPTTNIDMNTIYLVPKQDVGTQDIYDEYICLDDTTTPATWEKIGTTEIDLSDYVTDTELTNILNDYVTSSGLSTILASYATTSAMTTALADKVDKVSGKGLSTEDYTTAEKTKVNGLATVATSGSYIDLTDKPTIPTVNNNTISITQNGTAVDSFTLNQNSNKTIEVKDEKVKQSAISDNSDHPILLSKSANTTEKTDGTYKADYLTYNRLDKSIRIGEYISQYGIYNGWIYCGYYHAIEAQFGTVNYAGELSIFNSNGGKCIIDANPSLGAMEYAEVYLPSANGTLALQSQIPDELADLSDDATHRLVTDTEKSTWNGKAELTDVDKAELNTWNLLRQPYFHSSGSSSGTTRTVNADGSVTFTGTASATYNFNLKRYTQEWKLPQGTYRIKGCPSGGSSTTYYMRVAVYNTSLTNLVDDYGDGAIFTLTEESIMQINACVYNGYAIQGSLTFKPFIVPYENVTWFENNILGAKNLIPINTTEKSHTQNNVQFTLNEDGSIKAHITGTGNGGQFDVTTKTDKNLILPNGTYIFSGCPSGGSNTKYRCIVRVYNITTGTESSYGFDTGSGVTVTVNETEGKGIIEIACLIYSGYNGSDLLFKPMIKPSSIVDDTYTPPAQTNRQLTIDKAEITDLEDAYTDVYNLLHQPYYDQIENKISYRGVTWEVGSDNVKISGTATGGNSYYVFRSWQDGYCPNKNEVYHLEGCPSGGSNNSYYLVCQFVNSSGTTLSYAYDYGNGVDFVLPDGTAFIGIIFYVKANYAISGTLTITPRLTVARKFPTYQIGTIENGANASRAYAKNELMIWYGNLYRVTTAISSGGAISGKVTATTLSAEIKAIRDALNI